MALLPWRDLSLSVTGSMIEYVVQGFAPVFGTLRSLIVCGTQCCHGNALCVWHRHLSIWRPAESADASCMVPA